MHKLLSKAPQNAPTAAPERAAPASAQETAMMPMETYRYAGGVVQRQTAGVAAAEGGDAVAAANRTGLPDGLKSGIEALSGVSLDQVKVHYNSAEPATLRAHAYAQGSEIHLARGQERHLPHEAWHLVQQAQGRVAPSQQWRGMPVNNDPLLEREADRMGEAALRVPPTPSRLGGRPTVQRGVVQRTPDEALENLDEEERSEAVEALALALANARNLIRNYPLIRSNTQTYEAIRRTLLRYVADVDSSNKGFAQVWNKDLKPSNFEHYDEEEVLGVPKAPLKAWGEQEWQEPLKKWRGSKLADKNMSADLKLSRLIPLILSQPDYPEDLELALKLFFAHTASFAPEGRLGRDFREAEHGTYFRTSPTETRQGNTEQLKADYRKEWGSFPSGKTAQVLNRALFEHLLDYANLPSNIRNADLIGDDSDPLVNYAIYTSSNKSGTGSLGLIQNVYRTLQSAAHVKPGFDERHEWARTPVGNAFTPLVPEEALVSSSEHNYHDLLLADRSRLVAEVSEEIKLRYGEKADKWRVVPIQSPEHASLILEVEYPPDAKGRKLEEKAWRENFIAIFNQVAAEMDLQTRITHRSSFGFLYPTASSVGDPVRIWPGLVPSPIFKRLIFATLDALAKDEYWAGKKARFQALGSAESLKQSDSAHSGSGKAAPAPKLHIEALKSAVRYAQDVMRDTLTVKGPGELVNWLSVRLQHNLLKARMLLIEEAKEDVQEQEAAYLKSALVIENLMEYSYLLEALRADAAPSDDPYQAYVRKKLSLSDDQSATSYRHTRSFYLDSGMQAIVSAHLLARRWTLGKNDSRTKELRSLDLYSYFEYAGVDRHKLYFTAQNREKIGFHKPDDFWKTVKEEFDDDQSKPTVISADLNPVLTTREARENLVPYQQVFDHFAGKEDGKWNLVTVPIVDVTNASLDKVANLKLDQGYQNFIVVESLSKHQQLGADKFTMGRLTAVGSAGFVKLAEELLGPVAQWAAHRLPAAYRLRMDRVFYGDSTERRTSRMADELASSTQYDAFMALMGLDEAWRKLDRHNDGDPEQIRQRYFAMKEQLDQGFAQYAAEISHHGESTRSLEKAFQALPPGDQRYLLQMLEEKFGATEEDKLLTEHPYLLDAAQETGITNVGNTCYLSAALNMLAFSPYRALFQPRQHDPHQALRAMIKAALDKIVAGQLVTYDEVAAMLSALDHERLLEEPNALAAHRALNAQRDPAEVLEYVLNFFGVQQNGDYYLGQTTWRQLDLDSAQIVGGGDAAAYSDVDAQGRFAPEQAADWMIKLPISNFAGLAQAMHAYLAVEQTEALSGVYGRGTFQQSVLRGEGRSQVALGAQAPRAISIQLIRWVVQQGRVRKDGRAFQMPPSFVLNGFVYRLRTVIYHRGQSYEGGHYTTSTLDDQGAWQYRDDRQVVNNDQNVGQRVGRGYIYTYARERPANLAGDNLMLDLGHPNPGWGAQEEEEQPLQQGRGQKRDGRARDESSSSKGRSLGQDSSKKQRTIGKRVTGEKSDTKSGTKSKLKTKRPLSRKRKRQSGGESDSDTESTVQQGQSEATKPKKKKRRPK